MQTIGISHKTRYWQHYCFSNPPQGYRYARMADIPWHVARVRMEFLANTKFFLPVPKADLYHTYNSVVANNRPWVIEVESYLPRYEGMRMDHPAYKWALRKLAGKHCKALIFTSRNTLRMNRAKLLEAGLDEAKMKVVYRAVEQYPPIGRSNGRFRILFAGNGFYRKGGMELLQAFRALDREEAELVIISGLAVDWGITATREEREWAERTIQEHPRITWYSTLPHDQVVHHMRRANVFVATTYADPFNNTVLEAMGTGLPVICSSAGALPEVVRDGVNGRVLTVTGRSSGDIAEEVAMRLREMMDDSALCVRMGKANAGIISERFTLEVRNNALATIYAEALGERPITAPGQRCQEREQKRT